MTDIEELERSIIELLDSFLATYKHRGVFTATEIRDLLLDIRLLAMKGTNELIQIETDALAGANLGSS